MLDNLKRLAVPILNRLTAPNPPPADERHAGPVPTFTPERKARIQAIFDRAARRRLREQLAADQRKARR